MTPDEIAEAPLNDPTHPAIIERLSQDMRATAAALDASDARSFAADDPWKALTTLCESVVAMYDEAEMYRPTIGG